MTEGKTKSGFHYRYDEDDWELLEVMMDYNDDNPGAIVPIAKKMLGEDYNELKNHCRREDGKVSAVKMMAEVFEILNEKPGKNSLTSPE